MKGFKKILALGSAIGVMSSPLTALEIYKDGDTKVDLYGSIRAYYGGGWYANNGYGTSGMIYGLQNNSRLGVKVTSGKVSAVAELGALEDGINGTPTTETNYQPGFRHLWASYDFGDKGKILFGKTDTPSVADEMFVSNVLNKDQGSAGFGAIATTNKKLQIRYSINDFDIALVEDGSSTTSRHNSAIPRISVSWTYKDEKQGLNVKVGASYKSYRDDLYSTTYEGSSTNAYHVFVAAKKQLDNKGRYISGMVHYGMNAANYGEQYTSINYGAYMHTPEYYGSYYDTTRFGIYAETNYEVQKGIMPVLGVGYQNTSYSTRSVHTYMAMVQLPYELNKRITITPHVGWYGYNNSTSGSSYSSTRNSFVGVVRFNYTF